MKNSVGMQKQQNQTQTQKQRLKIDLLLNVNSEQYFNFINSLETESTKVNYRFFIFKFLEQHNTDLVSFLNFPSDEMRSLIIRYVVNLKLSKQYKQLVFYSLKHACEMNDIVLNWKKMSKFVKANSDNHNQEQANGNANGHDRGYTHEEILRIISHCDQRIRMVFLFEAKKAEREGVERYFDIGWHKFAYAAIRFISYTDLNIYPVYFLRSPRQIFLFVFPKFKFHENGVILNDIAQMTPVQSFVVNLK